MKKSFVDIIRPFHLAWKLRENGCSLTDKQKQMLTIWDNSTFFSPKELILNNNTADITITEIIEFLN